MEDRGQKSSRRKKSAGRKKTAQTTPASSTTSTSSGSSNLGGSIRNSTTRSAAAASSLSSVPSRQPSTNVDPENSQVGLTSAEDLAQEFQGLTVSSNAAYPSISATDAAQADAFVVSKRPARSTMSASSSSASASASAVDASRSLPAAAAAAAVASSSTSSAAAVLPSNMSNAAAMTTMLTELQDRLKEARDDLVELKSKEKGAEDRVKNIDAKLTKLENMEQTAGVLALAADLRHEKSTLNERINVCLQEIPNCNATIRELQKDIRAFQSGIAVSPNAPLPRLDADDPVGFLAGLQQFLATKNSSFRENRFKQPSAIGNEFFFDSILDRKGAFTALLNGWRDEFSRAGNIPDKGFPLWAVPSAPGTGKTRFISTVVCRGLYRLGVKFDDAEWEAALASLEDQAFAERIRNAVGVSVTFNHKSTSITGEHLGSMVAIRMLYSHFIGDQVEFERFYRFLKERKCCEMSSTEALNIIRHDINQALPKGSERSIILVVDEVMMGTMVGGSALPHEEMKRGVGTITSSLGQMLNLKSDHVFIVVTSLSTEILIQTWGSRRPVKTISMVPLQPKSVSALVDTQTDPAHSRLLEPVFQALIRESAGVPRILEEIVRVASGYLPPNYSLQDVRNQFGTSGDVVTTQLNTEFRSEAVLMAFGAWRTLSPCNPSLLVKVKDLVDRLIAAGYLYRLVDSKFSSDLSVCGVPAVILRVWHMTQDDQETLLPIVLSFLSDDVTAKNYTGPMFERQARYLIMILFEVDIRFRQKWSNLQHPPRSVFTIFGCDRPFIVEPGLSGVAVLPPLPKPVRMEVPDQPDSRSASPSLTSSTSTSTVSATAMSDGPWTDAIVSETYKDAAYHRILDTRTLTNGGALLDFNDEFDDLIPWNLFSFDRSNFAGVDLVMRASDLLVLFQTKYSAVDSPTSYKHYSSLATTLKDRPNLIRRFREGSMCFVLMAYQDSVRMNQTQFENVCREVHEKVLPTSSLGEVKKLVGQSVVFINRSHLHKLMGPTLAILDQFLQYEESFGERRPGKRAEFDVLQGAQ